MELITARYNFIISYTHPPLVMPFGITKQVQHRPDGTKPLPEQMLTTFNGVVQHYITAISAGVFKMLIYELNTKFAHLELLPQFQGVGELTIYK